jgi:hypothetical protein
MTQGIDMGRSGWDNPDGFTPRERDKAPAGEIPACEAAGPDGWVCDLPPGHRGDNHKAEGGPSWPTNPDQAPMRPVGQNITLPPFEADRAVLRTVRLMALDAAASDKPMAWALALTEIGRLTDGY